ncbi:MAG: hypothetical protein WCO23_05125 [bacterium]
MKDTFFGLFALTTIVMAGVAIAEPAIGILSDADTFWILIQIFPLWWALIMASNIAEIIAKEKENREKRRQKLPK